MAECSKQEGWFIHLRKEPVRKTFNNCGWKMHGNKCVGSTLVIKQTFDFMGPATWKPETCFCDMSLLLPFWTSPAARKTSRGGCSFCHHSVSAVTAVGAWSCWAQQLCSLWCQKGGLGHSSARQARSRGLVSGRTTKLQMLGTC